MGYVIIEQARTVSTDLLVSVNKLLTQLNSYARTLTQHDLNSILKSPTTRFFIAKVDNITVGMLTLVTYRIPNAKKGVLEDFVVDEKYRGKGIGRKLIFKAIEQARRDGVSYIDLTSSPTRTAANKLYKRLGFKKRNTNVYRITL